LIKLNKNENPILPPDNVIMAAHKGLEWLNKYSDIENLIELKELIGLYANIPSDRVIVASGSEMLIREVFNKFSKDRKIIMTNPSFISMPYIAKEQASKLIRIQLSPPEYKIDYNLIMEVIDQPTLLVIDNPNNPTGAFLIERENMKKILENENVLVLIDEAYYEFCDQTFLDMVTDYPNLAVARSLDKAFSLAGLRVGYLVVGDFFISKFSDFQMSLPRPAIYAAIEALKEPGYIKDNVKNIILERDRLTKNLNKLGCMVYPSNGNFLLVKSVIPDLARKLITYGMLIRDLSDDWLEGFYRITVGLPEENSMFLSAMRSIYEKEKQY